MLKTLVDKTCLPTTECPSGLTALRVPVQVFAVCGSAACWSATAQNESIETAAKHPIDFMVRIVFLSPNQNIARSGRVFNPLSVIICKSQHVRCLQCGRKCVVQAFQPASYGHFQVAGAFIRTWKVSSTGELESQPYPCLFCQPAALQLQLATFTSSPGPG